tara:strand:+ start:117 stop:611 length:495 start_codon:yes stop_codon:yes gene_type:complete
MKTLSLFLLFGILFGLTLDSHAYYSILHSKNTEYLRSDFYLKEKIKGMTLKGEKQYKDFAYCANKTSSRTWFIADHYSTVRYLSYRFKEARRGDYSYVSNTGVFKEGDGSRWFLVESEDGSTNDDDTIVQTCEGGTYKYYYSKGMDEEDIPRLDKLFKMSLKAN